VNRPQSEEEEEAIRTANHRGRPLGGEAWLQRTIARHDLQTTLRPRGRQIGWRKVNSE